MPPEWARSGRIWQRSSGSTSPSLRHLHHQAPDPPPRTQRIAGIHDRHPRPAVRLLLDAVEGEARPVEEDAAGTGGGDLLDDFGILILFDERGIGRNETRLAEPVHG